MFDALFGSSPKRRTSKAAKVKKLAAKVAKIEKKRAMDDMEAKLKAKLSKLKGY